MDADQYASGLRMAYLVAGCLRNTEALPLAEMREAIDHADTVGPIVDPTTWCRKHRAMAEDRRVVEILSRAQSELLALPWPELVEGSTRGLRP